MTRELADRVAIVTGASSGLGRAIAEAMALAGAQVAVNHPPRPASASRAEDIVSEIRAAGGEAAAFAGDVSQERDVMELFTRVKQRFGRIDVLVSNAGIENPAPIQEMSLEQWRQVIDVNLTGAFLCARQAVREFLQRDRPPPPSPALGNIIFTSSVHEIIPWSFQTNYAASKGGLNLLMRSLAQEVAPLKIRVNSIAPGAIRTPINADAWNTEAAMAKLLALIPYGRIGEPIDVARAAVWLASDASDYVTGASLLIDGGMALYPGFRGGG